jgi:hypothetical protein
VRAAERSSFAVVAGSTRVVLPAAVDKPRPGTWLVANYVTLVLTEQFVLSVHVVRRTPLDRARQQYRGLDKDDSGSLVMERKMLLGIAAVSMSARNPSSLGTRPAAACSLTMTPTGI